MADEKEPLVRLADERLEAMTQEDWERYRELGEQMMDFITERNRLRGVPPYDTH